MFYVINLDTKLVEHEDKDETQCTKYLYNSGSLFGNKDHKVVVKGAKARKEIVGY